MASDLAAKARTDGDCKARRKVQGMARVLFGIKGKSELMGGYG